jgi:WD40 repeat protein
LPDLPSEAALYYPSSDWKHGIAVYPKGDIVLRDAQSRRQIAKIDTDGGVSAVSFSPDDSMVATTSSHENADHSSTLHLRIWNVMTGEMKAELRPFEQTTSGDIGTPTWWPDGKYILATVRDNPFGSNHDIGIWSVQSGRFRGEFSGCVYSADPLSIVLYEAKLFERCRDGLIFMWDAGATINRIAAYENSITGLAESK